MVQFADYIYSQPGKTPDGYPEYMPGMTRGKWDYVVTSGRHFDRDKFEDFKTGFYRFQDWDPDSGYPTRAALESRGMGQVADELQRHGKLGKRSAKL